MQFDFLLKPIEEPPVFNEVEVVEPVHKITPKKFAEHVLQVYGAIGGAEWLKTQALVSPADYLKLLIKLLPKQVDLGALDGYSVALIDQYGNTLKIMHGEGTDTGNSPEGLSDNLPGGSGQPSKQIATSGGPNPSTEDLPEIDIKETYDDNLVERRSDGEVTTSDAEGNEEDTQSIPGSSGRRLWDK